MSVSLVIPVKQLDDAKQRLGGILSSEERSALFKAMVEDVLEAATACDSITEVIVVTRDKAVTALAYAYSASVMPEPDAPGLIPAVTFAAKKLAADGVPVMMFLPGDIPLVTVEELEVVLDGFGESGYGDAGFGKSALDQGAAEFMIVPADDLGGSNCLLCSPPDCMEFGFGEDSFRRHLGFARDRDIAASVIKLPGIGLDVDTPEDLKELIARLNKNQLKTHTSRYLEDSGVMRRLMTQVEKRECV